VTSVAWAVERPLRVVRSVLGLDLKAGRSREKAVAVLAFICAAALLAGLFNVWTRSRTVQTGYEISGLEARNKELKNRKRELLLEIASLQSPGELEKKAGKQGLVFPSMGKVVHVP
jgi:cell division protein FtsL